MNKAQFLSKSTLYEDDYSCVIRNPNNEFAYSLHYHDFYECVIYLGDAGTFCIGSGEYPVRRGDIVLIDMFKPHTLLYRKHNFYERFSVSINLNLLISFSTSHSNLLDVFHNCNDRHPVSHLGEGQLQKYLTLLEEFRKINLSQGKDILEKVLVHQFLAYIYSDCYSGQHIDENESRHAQTIMQLLQFIDRHLSEEITLERLAAEVNYSEYYVSRLFKKVSGKNFTNYIQEKRIEEASCLIRSNVSVNQAAEQSGFNNYSYFYKTFKKIVGCSPADYQARYRNVKDLPH